MHQWVKRKYTSTSDTAGGFARLLDLLDCQLAGVDFINADTLS